MAARQLIVLGGMVCIASCTQQPKSGEVLDEAKRAGIQPLVVAERPIGT